TVYHATVPAGAVRRVLTLEADRMAGPRITAATVASQVAVIRQEVASRVLNRPYGRFPMPHLQQLMYTGYPNTHDGNGTLGDLESATADDLRRFFGQWYAPGNAVLSVTGTFDPQVVADHITREFSAIGPRPGLRRRLPNGLDVLLVRRSAVPLAEVRLRIPLGHCGPAATMLLGPTMLAGSPALVRRGDGAGVDAVADRLLISAVCPADRLGSVLGDVGECLLAQRYPAEAVAGERDRFAGLLATLAGSEPAMVADEELNRRLYGDHPYGVAPDVTGLRAVTAGTLTTLHADRIGPGQATLVVVGDVDPERATDLAQEKLGGWPPRPPAPPMPPVRALVPGGPHVVPRDGGRTLIRVAAEARPPGDPDGVALELAAVVLGGYCSSRLMTELRERLGVAYTPRAVVLHAAHSSKLVVSAQVGASAAGDALRVIRRELERLGTERHVNSPPAG
ncbi:MAG TPA: insulinase family protein, partial [Actinoplanes sp.]|nr:insulinase family protein [Actinoplanes sp.]